MHASNAEPSFNTTFLGWLHLLGSGSGSSGQPLLPVAFKPVQTY
jgi:hypothetical protein